MLNFESGDNDLKPITFGYIARTRVKVVVNKGREIVRVPMLLHRMSIQTQRSWCKRNRVDFIRPARKSKEHLISDQAA